MNEPSKYLIHWSWLLSQISGYTSRAQWASFSANNPARGFMMPAHLESSHPCLVWRQGWLRGDVLACTKQSRQAFKHLLRSLLSLYFSFTYILFLGIKTFFFKIKKKGVCLLRLSTFTAIQETLFLRQLCEKIFENKYKMLWSSDCFESTIAIILTQSTTLDS